MEEILDKLAVMSPNPSSFSLHMLRRHEKIKNHSSGISQNTS